MATRLWCVRGVALSAILVTACDPPTNKCSATLRGIPDQNATIAWGGTPPKVSAEIGSVALECIPEGMPGSEAEQAVRGSKTRYVIAATANVIQWINDPKWFDAAPASAFEDAIEFEAVTPAGVVLGNGRATFRLVGGNLIRTVPISGRIENLSPEEVARVSVVRARWTYGRK
jgi:hypothetical protein